MNDLPNKRRNLTLKSVRRMTLRELSRLDVKTLRHLESKAIIALEEAKNSGDDKLIFSSWMTRYWIDCVIRLHLQQNYAE